jgi:hypothetical protein
VAQLPQMQDINQVVQTSPNAKQCQDDEIILNGHRPCILAPHLSALDLEESHNIETRSITQYTQVSLDGRNKLEYEHRETCSAHF